MKIVSISDTHSKHNELEIPECDLFIHGGDFTYFSNGGESEIIDFLTWFSLQPAKHKVFIAGNHEVLWESKEQYFKNKIPEGVYYLNDSMVEIDGIKIWGSPITPYFYGWAYNRNRGEEIKKHWDLIPDDIDILVTHGPAFGIMDKAGNEHVGCEELLFALQRVKPKMHLHGHMHRKGHIYNNNIHYFNCAMVNSKYNIVNKPSLINFDANGDVITFS